MRRMTVFGPSRHFAATPDVGRSRTETDINRQARPAASVANDPQETCSALNCCCAKLGIRGRSTRGNFLIDQIANQDHVGRPGPITSPRWWQDAGHGQGSPSKQTGQMASAVSGSWHGLIA
jgi:hypothetical protein